MRNRFDSKHSWCFTVAPYEAKLLKYLQSNNDRLSFTKAMGEAAQAFWMPFAVRWENGADTDVSRFARRALYRLEQRKVALPQILDVPDPNWHNAKLVSEASESQLSHRGLFTQVKVDLRFQGRRDSDLHKLLKYMKVEADGFSMQEMIMSACSAYWICPAPSIEDLKQSVMRAICRLDLQLVYLRDEFGVTLTMPELSESEPIDNYRSLEENNLLPVVPPKREEAQMVNNLFS